MKKTTARRAVQWLALSLSVLLLGCGAGGNIVDPPRFTSADTTTVIFGDGMVDAGQADGKRYTVNDTRAKPVFKTWVEYLEENFGRTTRPSAQGGTDHAQGGARVALGSGSFAAQVAAYSATFDADDIVIVGIGVQDIREQVEAVKADRLTEAQGEEQLRQAAAAYVDAVDALVNKGARTLLLTTTHDLGKTRWAKDLAAEKLASRFSKLFESQVALTAQERYSGTAQRARVLFVRLTDTGDRILGKPAGFDKESTPLCTGQAAKNALQCTDKTLVTDDAAKQRKYAYADHLYLSPAGHQQLAKYIRSYLGSRWGI